MSIGIIGAGALGSNLARLLAKSGISTTIANRRGPHSLKGLVDELGPSLKAGTVPEAASADIVVVAVRWVDVEKALTGLPGWNGRIVIDGTNALVFPDPDSPDAKDPSNPLAAFGIKTIDLGGKHSEPDISGARSGGAGRQSVQSSPCQRLARSGSIGRAESPILFG
jgi:8-hydroxy-5-deazaflavin:NADPH oxidoreductase